MSKTAVSLVAMVLALLTLTGGAARANSPGHFVYLPVILSAQPEDFNIFLSTRTITPQPGLEPRLAAALRQRLTDRLHVIIQFDHTLTTAERQNLAARGVTLLGYLPHRAWFASVPADEAAVQGLLATTPARWLGSILPEDKYDPLLMARGAGAWAQNPDGTVKVKVSLFEDVAREAGRQAVAQAGGRIESEFVTRPSFYVSLPLSQIAALAAQDIVQSVAFFPPPPTTLNDGSTAWTGADAVQALGITGAGVVVSLWDGDEVDDDHDDLAGRVVLGDATGTTSDHSTHVACTMAGNGSVNAALSGYAPGAPTIVSYNFNGNVPNEYAQALTNNQIQVANNSWGRVVGWTFVGGANPWTFINNQNLFGQYGSAFDAQDYDDFVRDNRLTIAWAVGNDRNDPVTCCTIPPTGPGSDPAQPPDWDQGVGNNGYDTLGPHAAAKNVISVGAISDGTDTMSTFSGWGPTDDGRIKPDVVAPGVNINSCDDNPNDTYTSMNGTSMASPAVAGSAALIIQQYQQTFGVTPLPSTIKALLVNEAVDLTDNPQTVGNDGLVGPDFIFGWGRINVLGAVNRVRNRQVIEGSLDEGEAPDTYQLKVLAGTPRLRVTIAWDDEAATDAAQSKLVNDLDLVLIDPNGNSRFPWRLNPQNPNTPATTGVDSRNNVEQVEIINPIPGVWTVRVSPTNVPAGPQAYSLVPFQSPADLSLTKTESADPVTAGTNLTYNLGVTNNGPGAASGVTVVDNLPAGTTFVSSVPAAPTCNALGGTLTCNLGSLAAGASANVTIVVAVPASSADGSVLTNSASVSGNEFDPNIGNDSDTETTTVVRRADLAVAKTDAPDPVLAEQHLTYTLQVKNDGPSDASGVVVTDVLPAGTTFDSSTPGLPVCSEAGGTVTCTLGNLAVGASTTITIVVVPSGGCSPFLNAASVAGNELDPNNANNSANAATTVFLDDFNRPDGGLNGLWRGARSGYRISGGEVDVRTGGAIYWPEVFGSEQSACVTLTKIDPTSRHHTLMLKVQGANDYGPGAILVSYNALSQTVDVETRNQHAGDWNLVASFAQTLSNGDRLGARALSDGRVEVFVNQLLIGTADAGAFYAGKGGQIGLWWLDAPAAMLDDFSGGEH